MKKIILYSLLFCGLAMMFTACRKDDVQPPPDLRFPLPLLTKDTTGDDIYFRQEIPQVFLESLW